MSALSVGDRAPSFSLPCADGTRRDLAELGGRVLVLYFYPKADTEACTAEALDFSALKDDFAAAGAAVVGVSPDGPARLARFARKFALTIALLADEGHATAEAYGIWVEKTMYGRRFMGVERATFLIDRNGRIAQVWRKVRVRGHAAEVLSAVRTLIGQGTGG
jgi:peroxiredoxin Q/BCP